MSDDTGFRRASAERDAWAAVRDYLRQKPIALGRDSEDVLYVTMQLLCMTARLLRHNVALANFLSDQDDPAAIPAAITLANTEADRIEIAMLEAGVVPASPPAPPAARLTWSPARHMSPDGEGQDAGPGRPHRPG
jgi:hypothetical protein